MNQERVALINSKIPEKLHKDLMDIVKLNKGTITQNKIVERGIILAIRELNNGGVLTRREIIKIVADGYGISPEELYGKSRKREIVRARYAAIRAMYILQPNITSTDVGRSICRDHSTVLKALGKLKKSSSV